MKRKTLLAAVVAAAVGFTCCAKENVDMVRIPGKNCEVMKTEVTQKLYVSVMGENPSKFKGDNRPVESVSWYDAIYFCNKLSKLNGLQPVYAMDGETDPDKWYYTPNIGDEVYSKITQDMTKNGYRLPTYMEWKYAARGGQKFKYAGSDDIDEVAWYNDNSEEETHPVAQKKPNGYGLYDMSGNVKEWCYDGNCYYCGGSWIDSASYCKVDSRTDDRAYYRSYCLGFRLVRSVK